MPAALLSTVGVVVSALLDRRRRARAVRPLLARGVPARRRRRVDRRRRRLRDAPLHAHPPPARAHARGRVGRQRPDGDRADARADRVDRATATRTGSATSCCSSCGRSGSACSSGVVLGAVATWVFARIPASIGAFAPVASVAAAALSFGAADVIGGSGFLAVYLVGLAVGSTPSRYRRQLVAFHEGARVPRAGRRCSSCSACSSSRASCPRVALPGSRSRCCSMLVARPAAVWVSTALSATSRAASALLLGWAGLARRRADRARHVRALVATSRTGETIFNAVFFVVLVSTIAPGDDARVGRAAARPELDAPPPVPEPPLEVGARWPSSTSSSSRSRTTTRSPARPSASSACRATRSSRSIDRDNETIPPRGSTVVAARRPPLRARPAQSSAPDLEDVFARWRRRV